ncbi:MAG: phytoene desaturase family protein [Cytophaga sp.]|uniref:phytoene desaturase family protein n=1 Tax=Cytophaga sp. TaxID=29535 RepID=UPI003F801CB7
MNKYEYDAVVVGSGPNGLAAAITLQRKGLSVLVLEAKDTIGGGLRTKELTLPGFRHDVCSAIHPMAVGSPFFAGLPLEEFGLQFVHAPIAAAHPFDSGEAAILSRSLELTADSLGIDRNAYLKLIEPLVKSWTNIAPDAMGPLRFPKYPLQMAAFGLNALRSADCISQRFKTEKAKGLWAGMSAHAIQPLTNWASAAIGLVLSAVGHIHGWPIPVGGSQSIADALAAYFISLGGKIQTGIEITSLKQIPFAKAVLFDVTPKQLLNIAEEEFTPFYRKQLERYRYGMGVFKIDWALSDPVPFKSPSCRQAGTVHLGNTFKEIALSEHLSSSGVHPEKPFVLLAQQSSFDRTRAPEGKHTVWAYCHVPNGSTVDMTQAIEKQVERFAPGFRDTILAKQTMNTHQIQAYNPNYIGGDINGGIIDIRQLYTRPSLSLSPYRTSKAGIYICSSSTPPGGGVHGMCGYHAAQTVMKDLFN